MILFSKTLVDLPLFMELGWQLSGSPFIYLRNVQALCMTVLLVGREELQAWAAISSRTIGQEKHHLCLLGLAPCPTLFLHLPPRVQALWELWEWDQAS